MIDFNKSVKFFGDNLHENENSNILSKSRKCTKEKVLFNEHKCVIVIECSYVGLRTLYPSCVLHNLKKNRRFRTAESICQIFSNITKEKKTLFFKLSVYTKSNPFFDRLPPELTNSL